MLDQINISTTTFPTTSESTFDVLLDKINSNTALMGVIGLGYVGLPEAVEFARAGFTVTGIDVDIERVQQINNGISYIQDIDAKDIAPLLKQQRFQATNNFSCISQLDTINICVPTPLRKTKEPDLSYILSAMEQIKKYIRRGQLIILESTTYPGTTAELLLPILNENGLKVGEDFFLAFSPERIDPGNVHYQTGNIPKVVGGMTPQCTKLATALYKQIIDRVVPVSSPSVAEMVKLLENTFRSVNIGLVNEIALMCHTLQLNVWEVIDAAATKPFGFMPFYPGPGVGGHCIPLDPFYLSWKARMHGFEPRFIDLAGQINSHMPVHVVNRVGEALNNHCKSLRNSRVHVMGVTYKRDVNDARESPALEVIHLLLNKGAIVTYSDPYIPHLTVGDHVLTAVEPTSETLANCDCVALLTDHQKFDYPMMVEFAPTIVDTRNALRNLPSEKVLSI